MFQTFSYDHFMVAMLPRNCTEFYLTDDTGHLWKCANTFVDGPDMQYKIGGRWQQYTLARGLRVGSGIMIGAPRAGNNLHLYLTFKF
jgi:hypothetical protein